MNWTEIFSKFKYKRHCKGGGGEGGRERAGCLTLAVKVTIAGGTTFPHVNTFSRPSVTRQLDQKMRANAMTRMFTAIFFLSSAILSNMFPGRTRISRCQISHTRSVKLSRWRIALGTRDHIYGA